MSHTETDNSNQEQQLFVYELLDSYFFTRASLPKDGYIQEDKTTQQIQDDLLPMYPVSAWSVVDYMRAHKFATVTEQDGTVAWAIWRLA